MTEIIRIGLDLAKNIFQVHGVNAAEEATLRRAVRRGKVLEFFGKLAPCLVGLEACATSHYWARELSLLGHTVKLIPPSYTKAYVRRNKNDAADAAAICEAVSRPSMRFVTIKTEAQQAASGMHKVREALIKQRTMTMNTLRGLMAEFGIVAAEGPHNVSKLVAILRDAQDKRVPEPLHRELLRLADLLTCLEEQVAGIDKDILAWGRANKTCRHLSTAPGYGPILSSAMVARVPKPDIFDSGRHFAASLGLVPGQHGTGGKAKLGSISKRGDGYLRRLLVNAAMSVLNSKWGRQDPWVLNLLKTKPRKVVAVALANKLARIGWALMMRQEDFRARPGAA